MFESKPAHVVNNMRGTWLTFLVYRQGLNHGKEGGVYGKVFIKAFMKSWKN